MIGRRGADLKLPGTVGPEGPEIIL